MDGTQPFEPVRTLPAIVLALLFLALALVARGGPLPGDEALVGALVGLGGDLPAIVSRVTSFAVWAPLVLVVAAALAIWRSRGAAGLLVLAVLTMELASWAIKEVVGRERPATFLLDDVMATASFPSGHVARVTVTLGILVGVVAWRSAWRIPAILIAAVWLLVVGLARVAVGAHWPSDVLGGYLLGAIWLAVAFGVAGRRGRSRPSASSGAR
ncbi:MAG: phosphatase PAP2 family protein [Chloroflexi bacterium]|nr:phosphatase PAP2 family protein [Chloroflexota bacterium]